MKVECFIPYLPRRLWAFTGKYWVLTGQWAWLRPIFRVETFWKEIYYVAVSELVSSEPYSGQTPPRNK